MARLAAAVVSAEQVEELKLLWASFGFNFIIQSHENFTGSHVRVYLYEHGVYSEKCGEFSGKKFMSNGWDQSDEIASIGYDEFVIAATSELQACCV